MGTIYIDDEARKVLIEHLDKYNGEPILFDMPGDVLKELIFDYDEKSGRYTFAMPYSIVQKIDFSNVPFDNVDVGEYDISELRGVSKKK